MVIPLRTLKARVLVAVHIAAMAAVIAQPVPGYARQTSAPIANCQSVQVPVEISDIADAHIYGVLCTPADSTPRTVQLLVHGATYNHGYWSPPGAAGRYSYVSAAVAEGYATFAVDRLGYGNSTRPQSSAMTFANGAEALHQVITQLRAGRAGGVAFSRVVWVGHSMGTAYAWVEAANHDVDAYVLTGLLHSQKTSWFQQAAASLYPATLDAKFADSGLDAGYLTTLPGTRGDLFYHRPGADPRMISLDEQLKDTVGLPELLEIGAYVGTPPPPPATSPSQAITAPTLILIGDADNNPCGPPDGIDCTKRATVASQETPYYGTRPDVRVIPTIGHSVQFHVAAPVAAYVIHNWLNSRLQ